MAQTSRNAALEAYMYKILLLRVLAAVVFLLSTAAPGFARCEATGADATDVANARAAVAANCNCAGATNHGDYVSCAAEQANATLVNKSCRGAVKRCAAKSTCGKPGFVTCCTTNSKGASKCKTKSDPALCVAPKDGTACVGQLASCCDACAGGTCVTTTTIGVTTTTTP